MQCSFFWLAISFISGVLSRLWLSADFSALFFCLLLMFLLRERRAAFRVFLCMAWFFLGLFYAQADTWRPVNAVERRIPSEQEETTLAGRVISSPEWSARGKRKTCSFILEAQRLGEQQSQVSGRVRVFLYNPGKGPEPGDFVELAGSFRPVRPIDGFDYPRYLWSIGIEAVFQGAGRKSLKVLKPASGSSMKSAVFRLRESLSRWMGMGMAPQPAALARALVLGLKGGIHPDLREDFFRTGTSQVLATASRGILGNSFTSSYAFKPIA